MEKHQRSLGYLLNSIYKLSNGETSMERIVVESAILKFCYDKYHAYCKRLGVFNKADRDAIISRTVLTILMKASENQFENERVAKAYLNKIVFNHYRDWFKKKMNSLIDFMPHDQWSPLTFQPTNNVDVEYCIRIIKDTLNEEELDFFVLIETRRVTTNAYAKKVHLTDSAIRHRKKRILIKLRDRLTPEKLDKEVVGFSFIAIFEERIEPAFLKFQML